MAHEITNTDGVVLHAEPAWHGLGTIVEKAPTPADALKIAGLDWKVEQWPLVARQKLGDGDLALVSEIHLKNLQANVRSDTEEILGTVGPGYQPIQNADLADFCQLLAEQGDQVKCETAGSIRGGAKVWFLLKGESFEVHKRRQHYSDDRIVPYILVSNGHDGGTALRCTPTTVRVVCSNTLHMVIPSWEPDSRVGSYRGAKTAGFVACHTGDVRKKVEQAKQALELYGRSKAATIERIGALASRDWNSEAVSRFLVQVYATTIEPIPTNPKTKEERDSAEKAAVAIKQMLKRFDLEAQKVGPSAWTAVNAFTGWQQHDKAVRFRDPVKAREAQLQAILFGDSSSRSVEAFAIALTI